MTKHTLTNPRHNFNHLPFAPKKLPFFYGWAILVFSALGILMSMPGQTIGVSAFIEHLIRDLHISRSDLTFAYMIGTIVSSLLLVYAGKIYDLVGARIVCFCASIGLGITMLLLSQINYLTELFFPNGISSYTTIGIMIVGFFLLRFFGQGVLTLGSRNMLMKWFDKKRGLATGLSGPIVTTGLSATPFFLNSLINKTSWNTTWLILGIISIVLFSSVIAIFFRDNPEACGLLPDGEKAIDENLPSAILNQRQFTVAEARRHWPFWVFALTLSLFGFYITAVTFNIVSIFAKAAMSAETAFAVLIPGTVIAVIFNIVGGIIADRIKPKYLLMVMLSGVIIANISLYFLAPGITVITLIIGNGIGGGLFGVLSNVTFPRFYGREHLGAINGFIMSLMVFSSAIAPWMFSKCLDLTGTYRTMTIVCTGVALLLLFTSFKADSPADQEK
jgi:MFS transporter, OFA family, oxalate/formate antiporter